MRRKFRKELGHIAKWLAQLDASTTQHHRVSPPIRRRHHYFVIPRHHFPSHAPFFASGSQPHRLLQLQLYLLPLLRRGEPMKGKVVENKVRRKREKVRTDIVRFVRTCERPKMQKKIKWTSITFKNTIATHLLQFYTTLNLSKKIASRIRLLLLFCLCWRLKASKSMETLVYWCKTTILSDYTSLTLYHKLGLPHFASTLQHNVINHSIIIP